MVALARHLHEILGLDPQFTAKRHGAFAQFRLEGVIGRETRLALPLGVVVDNQLQRIQYRNPALGHIVQHLALRVFKQLVFDQRIAF